jgi:hypothetical protein
LHRQNVALVRLFDDAIDNAIDNALREVEDKAV